MTADFDFLLPPALIAQAPATPRTAARLLVVDDQRLADRHVADLPTLLRAGDLLVVNDTRVIPADLTARRGAARIGLTLDRKLADDCWTALARNARRLRVGDRLDIDGPAALTATCLDRAPDGGVTLRFDRAGTALDDALSVSARLALPPYIARPDGPTEADRTDYQTTFARNDGAVAAPTAGLHFTPDLLAALDAAGIARAALTLHVGPGTFLPLRDEAPERRRLHPERAILTADTARAINDARRDGRRVVAVGTTSLRLLETATDAAGHTVPFDGDTDIFIRPGTRVRGADLLLTNFHLPRSSLFMLVCAFAGTARMRDAYAHAIERRYRFYSYGDACLIARHAA